jgi:hypothetical protein
LVIPNFRPTDTHIHIKEKNATYDVNANVNRNKHFHDYDVQAELILQMGQAETILPIAHELPDHRQEWHLFITQFTHHEPNL